MGETSGGGGVGVSLGEEWGSIASGTVEGPGTDVDDDAVGEWDPSTVGCECDAPCNSRGSESDSSLESLSGSESKSLSSRSRSASSGGNCTISGACGKSWASVE
jgi:hypothetical protein